MRIFLFRGLFGNVFSTGIDRLAKKLQRQGHTVSVHLWTATASVKRKFLQDAASEIQQVAVIGHSLGANSAIDMANDFAAANIEVRYLATMDPTIRKTAASQISIAHNFRSRDIRDKPIAGAVEFLRNDLNHIQIDKDPTIHNIVIKACSASSLDNEMNIGEVKMANTNTSSNIDAEALLNALTALIGTSNQEGKNKATSNPSSSELTKILEILALSGNDTSKDQASSQLTPVNAALGQTIGNTLDGRKTGIGIIGLLGSSILPVLFPQLTPVVEIIKSLGLGGTELVKDPQNAPNVLQMVFGGMASWGILGKLDKWANKISGQ